MAVTYNLALKLLGLPEFQGDTKKASRSWQDIGRDTQRFQRQTNLTRDAMRDFREEGEKLVSKFREIFPQFSGLAGLLGGGGLIAGLAGLGRNFANVGTEILNTSHRIGISEKLLQGWRKAADLAGDSADDATSSFRGLSQNIFAAERGQQAGINAQIVAGKYGVRFGRGKEEQTLRDLNRAFNTNPLLKNNPQKAQGVEQAITGDTGLYDLLSKPTADFNRIMKESLNTPGLTKQQAEDAARAHEAFSGLTQAVGQLGLDFGAFTNKWLVPLETAMTKVINAVGKSPGATTAVDVGVTAIAAGIAAKMLGSVGKLIGVLPKGLKIPAGPIGALIGTALEAIDLIGKYPTATPNKPFENYLKTEGHKDKSADAPRLLRDSLDALKRSIDSLANFFGFGGAGGGAGGGGVAGVGRPRHGDILGPPRPAGPLDPAREKKALDFFMANGYTRAQAAGIVATLEQESRLDPTARNASGHLGIAQLSLARQAALGPLGGSTDFDQQLKNILTELNTTEASANARIKATSTAGGAAGATRDFFERPELGGDAGAEARAGRIYGGMAPRMPTAADPFVPPGGGSRVPAYLQNLPGSEDRNPGPQSSLDTKHHFVLEIRGAPPGTRGQMASADGPATAEVKTSYALAGV